jgi:hypothetical protein
MDRVDIKTLESRAPGISTVDAQFVREKILGGAILRSFSTQERAIICENILTFKGLIPSLLTFFQDVHFLEAVADGMKWLVTVPRGETVFSALASYYERKEESQQFQTTETTFQSRRGSRQYCCRLGYLVLVVFAMRHHRNLPKAPVKTNLKTLPRACVDQAILQRFASLAAQLGFRTPEVLQLTGHSILPPVPDGPECVPLLVTTGPGESLAHRYGLPRADNFERDQKSIFLHNLCSDLEETGEGITSFFVLKCWFAAFFDPPRWSSAPSAESHVSPAPPPQMPGEDVNMGDTGTGPSGQQAPEPQQERPGQQEVPAMEADRTPEGETEGLFGKFFPAHSAWLTALVPEHTTQRQAAARAATVIRFVERGGRDMPDKVAMELAIDYGDPTSRVERQVGEFLRQGMRTCDRYKKYIPEKECYRVATMPENHDTLFLIPDIGRQRETVDQVNQTLPDANAVALLEAPPGPEGENVGQEEDDLLETEIENATNAQILDRDTTIIYFKKRVGASNDTLKPVEALTWEDVTSLEVPPGDPGDVVSKRAEMFGTHRQWLPYDRKLRRLAYGDCYRVAVADKEHTLFLMPWRPPDPLPADAFTPNAQPSRRVARAPPQAQQPTGFESSRFAPSLHVSPLPSQQEVDPQQPHWNIPRPPPDRNQPPLVNLYQRPTEIR